MGLTSSEGANALESIPTTERALTEAPSQTMRLPDKPIFVIQRGSGWDPVSLKEAWIARELLYYLTWRDVKVRYKQTFLGVLWVIVQPLVMILIFSVFFGRLAGLE